MSGKVQHKEQKTWYKKIALEIDMNPMVDLAFLLITFFMLTTTFSKQQAMELTLPVKPKSESMVVEQAVKESKVITVILAADDKIYYYAGITDPELVETTYQPDGLRNILIRKNKEIDELVVLIKPMEVCRFKNYVDILDEMQLAEIKRYAIVDPDPIDHELIAEGIAK